MCLVSFSRTPHYSALKKLESKLLPAWAYVVICDDCTHRCGWCYGEFNHDLHQQMSFDAFKTIVLKLKEMGVAQLSFAGGEPTEHPEFRQFVEYAAAEGFILHVVSHGEHIDAELAQFLADQRVEQVQINWQGSRHHDAVHGVVGAYDKAVRAIKCLSAVGIETTTTITVGRYNLPHIDEIMAEAAHLGVTRLRVWEATGYGNPFRKGETAKEIFEHCQEAAAQLGYTHCLSYDPEFRGDVWVPCLQFSNLFMYINSHGKLEFCGAVANTVEIADFLNPEWSGEQIRQAYLARNAALLGNDKPYCVAREGFGRGGADLRPVKWHSRKTVGGQARVVPPAAAGVMGENQGFN